MQPRISPALKESYIWEKKQEGEKLIISFQFPEDFDISQIKYQENQERTEIVLRAPNQVPLLAGKLYEKIIDHHMSKISTQGVINLEFKLGTDKEWPTVIVDVEKCENVIDPYSALILAHGLDDKTLAAKMLDKSVGMGFLPAMLHKAMLIKNDPNQREQYMKLINCAIDEYGDPYAMFSLAIELYEKNTPEGYRSAFPYFQGAAESGKVPTALSFVGLYYSPLTIIPFENKNGEEAVRYFQRALEINNNDPIPLHNLSIILFNGCIGVEKDVNRALTLNERARKQDEIIPHVQDVKVAIPAVTEERSPAKWIAIGVSVAAVAALGFMIFKRSKK